MKNKKFFHDNAANFVTFCNMLAGATSIIMSLNGKFRMAMAFIIIASIADRYDGRVARRLNTDSELGVQMDSMGDVISFGVAPAILVYMSRVMTLEGNIRIIGGVATMIYICAGAFRLARFNVDGMNEDNSFYGMPIPIAGLILVAMLMFGHKLGIIPIIVAEFILAMFMISKIRIKKK